jgi:chaperonin GroEL (HSP60 family)
MLTLTQTVTLTINLQVRVVKIPGGGIHDSSVVRGMVLKRDAEGTIKRVTDAKVAVFAQGIDTAGTETKVLSPTSAAPAEQDDVVCADNSLHSRVSALQRTVQTVAHSSIYATSPVVGARLAS